MRKILAVLAIAGLLVGVVGCAGSITGSTVTLNDASGEVLATPTAKEKTTGYVRYVLDEAIALLADMRECDAEEASVALFSGGYEVDTTAKPAVMAAVEDGYTAFGQTELPFGCAVTDLSGGLLALYSGGGEDYAAVPHAPHSAIKPLSVYAPSVENKLLDWSSTIEDKPYKKLKNEDGEVSDWPQNATGTYTYQPTSLYQCLSHSLNTAAVRQLKTLGAKNAVSFLSQSFGWDVAFEERKLNAQGEEEILGNLALGMLYAGVTPAQLAAAYQVFATGGRYERPHAVTEIRDQDGKVLYRYEGEETQVIREDTATIMNRLLKGVVSAGGTGAAAKAKGAELVGKTGTGDDNTDNWFVGVTPEYSCAVWHGTFDGGNRAAAIFTEIFKNVPKHTESTFKLRGSVKKVVLCAESGLQMSAGCTEIQLGYYAANRVPAVCDRH